MIRSEPASKTPPKNILLFCIYYHCARPPIEIVLNLSHNKIIEPKKWENHFYSFSSIYTFILFILFLTIYFFQWLFFLISNYFSLSLCPAKETLDCELKCWALMPSKDDFPLPFFIAASLPHFKSPLHSRQLILYQRNK
jgi:hypothetical protein